MAQWDEYSWRSSMATTGAATTSQYLFSWPGKRHETLYASLASGEIYKVDNDTDNIAEDEVYGIWPQVEQADSEEIKQFVDTGSFKKVRVSSISSDTVIIDSVWIRKWKRYPDGSRKVKSRLCARGCFDNQRDTLSTRSTMATRLSQRLLVSTAVNHDHDTESWDVSGAFLKGLTFEKVRELLASRGITSPVRKVVIIAPANVWRHLAKFDASFRVDYECLDEWALLCIKPVYGLNDAPLAWQLCLRGHWEEQGGVPSLLDENYFIWRFADGDRASVTTHVDDCGAEGKRKWLDEQYQLLVKKFGKVTRQTLPFTHCGVVYRRIPDGICMEQDDFCSKLKTVDIDPSRGDSDSLTATELTSFRSVLGALLWLTATRLDLIAEVCILQSMVTKATIGHLKQANQVVRKAQSEIGQGLGLYFRKLRPPFRLACIHDSSAAGSVRQCAQEGIMILLMEDHLRDFNSHEEVMEDHQTHLMGGKCHVLWAHGAKAKRVSYSTSHAETLAAVSCMETSTLVAVRLGELLYTPKAPTVQSLLLLQEGGVPELPCDGYTDCKDLWELASGSTSVAQDKTQRLPDFPAGSALTPTESMLSDALTKGMLAPQMMGVLSSGVVQFFNEAKHKMTLRRVPKVMVVTEEHLNRTDKELIRDLRVSTSATVLVLLDGDRCRRNDYFGDHESVSFGQFHLRACEFYLSYLGAG
ncbi:ACBD6 [Symbiodinium pilosum]|uniref:ACBD6 protein n=1 Tax=Symbiodinium pilosum TaxID=2952 RepID=A0A812SM85_SYMPI|nr:ACBD6 [Symbiodinium pilosum]